MFKLSFYKKNNGLYLLLTLPLLLALLLPVSASAAEAYTNPAVLRPLTDLGDIQSGAAVASWGYAATGLALSPDDQSLYIGYINTLHSVDQYTLPISSSPIPSVNHAPYYGGSDIYGGNGGAHYPVALATDAAGNVYVANKDAGGETIPDVVDRFNNTLGGHTNTITYPDATEPIGLAVVGSDLYVVLRDTTLLEKRTTAGVFVNSVNLAFTPYGVEVDAIGNIWVVGSSGNVAIYDAGLNPVNTLTIGGVGNLADIAFFDQTAYITERYGSRVFVVDFSHTLLETWDYDPGSDARGFYGLDITANGLIYLAGHWAFTPDGRDHLYTIQLPVPPAPATNTPSASSPAINTGVDGSTHALNGVWLKVPAGAIPSSRDADNNACTFVVKEAGTANDYGFNYDEVVWDIKLFCDGKRITQLNSPMTICVRPSDGNSANKTLFHRHDGQTVFSGLPAASGKAGWVCGSTSQLSLFLAGEYLLPETGFAPQTVTDLNAQPAELAYASTGIVLNIPKLGITQNIVGVPQSADGWDVSWLGNGVGYLSGTAFPTWAGNTALTGHVWNADGSPGIFASLNELQHGDRFTIEAWGLTYIYEVRDSAQVYATNLNVLTHSDYDIITLLTCEDFSEYSGDYRYRRAVTAVLVAVK